MIKQILEICPHLYYGMQGRNNGENLCSALSGWDRVKVTENLGATAVAPVAPADTSLN